MKKKVTITMEYIFEVDDDYLEEGDVFENFDAIRNADYDGVDRPLERMEEEGWQMRSAIVE